MSSLGLFMWGASVAAALLSGFITRDSVLYSAGLATAPPELKPKNAVRLAVPYLSQAPRGNWNAPWNNACEEASATMVDFYYRGLSGVSTSASTAAMQTMIDWENKTFFKNDDTNAEETATFINSTSYFNATVVRNPSTSTIVAELAAERPVIAMINVNTFYGEKAKKNAPTYHVVVIIGFDNTKKEFLVNDPARAFVRSVSYQRVMSSLHDMEKRGQATGVPTVLFTRETAGQTGLALAPAG